LHKTEEVDVLPTGSLWQATGMPSQPAEAQKSQWPRALGVAEHPVCEEQGSGPHSSPSLGKTRSFLEQDFTLPAGGGFWPGSSNPWHCLCQACSGCWELGGGCPLPLILGPPPLVTDYSLYGFRLRKPFGAGQGIQSSCAQPARCQWSRGYGGAGHPSSPAWLDCGCTEHGRSGAAQQGPESLVTLSWDPLSDSKAVNEWDALSDVALEMIYPRTNPIQKSGKRLGKQTLSVPATSPSLDLLIHTCSTYSSGPRELEI